MIKTKELLVGEVWNYLQKKPFYLFQWNIFKNDDKWFLFHLNLNLNGHFWGSFWGVCVWEGGKVGGSPLV